jgi:hypothetical protein
MISVARARLTVAWASCLALAACGTTLLAQPIERQADAWTIRLERMAEGFDSPPLGAGVFTPGTIYKPEDGQRFLHLFMKIRNEAPAPRTFSYEGCDLDLSDGRITPGVITNYNGVAQEIAKSESYSPGDEKSRWLIFSYPEGKYPTRLKCQSITIAFPPLGAAASASH